MCFGSGAPKVEKTDFGPLPSLSMKDGERKVPKLQDVKRKGQKTARSLLKPEGYGSDATG